MSGVTRCQRPGQSSGSTTPPRATRLRGPCSHEKRINQDQHSEAAPPCTRGSDRGNSQLARPPPHHPRPPHPTCLRGPTLTTSRSTTSQPTPPLRGVDRSRMLRSHMTLPLRHPSFCRMETSSPQVDHVIPTRPSRCGPRPSGRHRRTRPAARMATPTTLTTGAEPDQTPRPGEHGAVARVLTH